MDRRNTAVTSSSFHGNSEVKPGEAVIGWQARSGRTMSEGLKGFPWPLMPPEILKPRPGFFSILTHNYRERGGGGGEKKDRKEKERQVTVKHKDHNNLYTKHRVDRHHVQRRFHVMCDMLWQLYWRSSVLWQQQLSHKYPCQIFFFNLA